MNKNRQLSRVAFMLCLTMVLGMFGGFTAFAEAPVTIVMGYNASTNPMDEEYWPTDFVTEMNRILGIDLQIEVYDTDKMNLVLASGELPDIMMVNPVQAKQVLDGGLAVAMDDYLPDYGANIVKFETRNEVIRHFMSNGDGKLYFHTPNTGIENATGGTELWNGYIVRWDVYKEIGAPEIKNDDDYVAVLKQMQAACPTTEDGKPTYGMGMHNDSGLWGWNIGLFANMGYQNNSGWTTATSYVTNEIISNYLDENAPFWASMRLFNKLYNNGLLDPDAFTMKSEEVNEKAGAGQYMGGYCTWFSGRFFTNEAAKDPNTIKGYMAVPAEGQGGWYAANHAVGWGDKALFVSTSARNPAKCVEVIDWFDTDEAGRLHFSGVEGQNWDYVGGVPTIKDEVLELRATLGTNSNEWKKYGIESFNNFIGASAATLAEDGHPYGLFDVPEIKAKGLNSIQRDFSAFYGVDYPAQKHVKLAEESKAFNQQNSLITAINIGISEIPSDISRIDAKVDEMAMKAIPTLVQAADDAAFEAAKAQFIDEIKVAGIEQSFGWWSEQWNTAKDYVESVVK